MFSDTDYGRVYGDPTASPSEQYLALAAMRIADRLELITSAAGIAGLLVELEPTLLDIEQTRRSVL